MRLRKRSGGGKAKGASWRERGEGDAAKKVDGCGWNLADTREATSESTLASTSTVVLNIDIICANSPQAKGRVERMNKTLQDRLVKELRL
jgi:hypothetical protein